MNLILPPTYLERIDAPLIFLAGPIQGAYDWQSNAIKIIQSIDSELYVASPRRQIKPVGEFTEEMYNEQVDWETYHLKKAGENGVVLFWLAKEFEHRCDRPYAHTTGKELFEWKVLHEVYGYKIALGMEEGFVGNRYINRRFSQDCPEIPILHSLEDTCKEAIRLLNYKK